MKSNLAIKEELDRLSGYLMPGQDATCPDLDCSNHGVGVSMPKMYQSFGKTSTGARRYRCKVCDKTFSVNSNPTSRQRLPEKNEEIFRLLVNKVPLKRMCELAGVNIRTLYRKIDFIHGRCLDFAGKQERRLPDLEIPRLYLSTDRQVHLINWRDANFKHNIFLHALGTADNKSGYVFGINVNYDSDVDAAKVELDSRNSGEDSKPPAFRRYARVWLAHDYAKALNNNIGRRTDGKQLKDNIQGTYDDSVSREDVEIFEEQTSDTGLPYAGMQVHLEYTLYAHFLLLKQLLGSVGKVRFFLDQESGIRAASLSAFWTEVLEKRCDAFYVRVNKDLTINQKRRLKAKSIRELAEFRASSASYEPLTDYDLRHIIIKERLQELVDIGKWHDRWLFYPFPDMSEPEKAICWLTDIQDRSYDIDHLAWLYSKGTLHGIDRFFMQARRRLSLLERPIASASSEGRKWYGYNPYNPAMVGKVLDIFRVFYNYIEVGKDKRTPAMRLGIVGKTFTYLDVTG
jgi:transposase-like protein